MTTRPINSQLTVSCVKTHCSGGFTLVEILVATVILGLVIAIVLGSFRSVFSRTEAIDRSLSQSQMVLACFNRLLTDIQATHVQPAELYRPAAPGSDRPADPYRWEVDTETINGQRFARLRFASRGHVAFGAEEGAGVAEIVYYVQQASGQRFVLRRSDRLDQDAPFEPKPWDPVVCGKLREFAVICLDADGKEHEQWDSEDSALGYATPQAVRLRISAGTDEQTPQTHQTLIGVPVFRERKK